MVKKVLSSKPLPLSKVKEVIKKRLEEEEGLDIQRTTLSYLERFAKCDSELVDEIIKELKTTKIPERAGRAQDKEQVFMMQKLRALGYM